MFPLTWAKSNDEVLLAIRTELVQKYDLKFISDKLLITV